MISSRQLAWFVFIGVAVCSSLRADEPPQHRRWAIVAAKSAQQGGLPDLLTAELSGVEGLQLVERDELLAATRELELSIYLGSQAAGKRLELGKLLKADAIVLLSLEKQQETTAVQLIICDCLVGARLRQELLPVDGQDLQASASRCAKMVLETRQRFAAGIKGLIAVAPFLSKNLTHEHDNLQTALPALVANSLGRYPGVAVVELEEAKSIARELALTGGELRHKFVTLFVDGEYRVAATRDNRPAAMRLTVRVNDGKRIRALVDRDGLPLDEAARLLSRQASQDIAAIAESERIQPFARSLQFDQLVGRAEAFSQSGAWREAASLREAALLLKPSLDQRLALIADYRRWQFADHQQHAQAMYRFIGDNWQAMTPELVEANWREIFDERLGRLRLVAVHTARAIRGGELNGYEASVLASACFRDPLLLKLSGENSRQDYRDALYDFFWDICPPLDKLDPASNGGRIRPRVARCDPHRQPRTELVGIASPASVGDVLKLEGRQRDEWTLGALGFLTRAAPLKTELGRSPNIARDTWDDRRTLDELYRFLTDVAPRDHPLLAMASTAMDEEMFSVVPLLGMVRAGRFSRDQMLQFCQRLERSGGRANLLYGRCGRLALKVRATGGALDESAVQEADVLLQWIADQRGESGDDQFAAGFDAAIAKLRHAAERRLSGAGGRRSPRTANLIPPVDPAPRLSFQPVDGVRPQWSHITRCSASLDLMWSDRDVFCMPEPGNVVKLYSAAGPRDAIAGAVWDGESVWIGSLQAGIRVVTPGGELLGQVGSDQGLPPFDDSAKQEGFARQPRRALLLHSLGPGRCVAIGRFGSRNRVWVAVISRQESADGEVEFVARVVHTATQIGDSTEGVEAIFDLKSLAEVPDPNDPRRRLLLVGRGVPEGWPAIMRPLAIDLATFKVAVFPAAVATPAVASLDGRHLYHASPWDITSYSAPAAGDGPWLKAKLASALAGSTPGKRSHFVPQLIVDDGKIYHPGVVWRRIDPGTAPGAIEQLNHVPLPLRHRFRHYGISAHYGLIGWNNRDRCYRVHIDRQPAEEPDLAALYPEVPADSRERHHNSVVAIRRLGGFVDARWGSARWGLAYSEESAAWYTCVHLPRDWQGGDEGLRHLQDLHNLRSLIMVQANVSDEGLRAVIAKLAGLQALQLVETAVTNAGLVELQRLPQLTHLRLEGAAGGSPLDDQCLQSVARIPRLAQLEIVGRGFTAAGLETIFENRSPFVQLIGTSVTKTQLVELRKRLPGLRASLAD